MPDARRQGFKALKAAYPEWDDIRLAPAARIETIIKSCGLAEIKTARIQAILNTSGPPIPLTRAAALLRLPLPTHHTLSFSFHVHPHVHPHARTHARTHARPSYFHGWLPVKGCSRLRGGCRTRTHS